MKRPFYLLAGLYLAFVCKLTAAEAVPPWSAIVVGEQSEPERLAAIDLQRYLAQATGKLPSVLTASAWQKRPCPAVVVGTLSSNPALKGQDLGAVQGKPEGYLLANATVQQQQVVVVAGTDATGAVQGIYGLLKELGFGFFLGSETVPAGLPGRLPQDRVVKVPALGIRGVLPWYNFFNSPTVWDPVDHRTFVDQLIRSGANFVGFHTYNSEPFAGVIKGERVLQGDRLLSTATRTWGTIPTKTADFGFGTANLYAQEYFGALTTELKEPVAQVVKKEQDIMRDALNYAKARGLHACVGFEIHGNPMNEAQSQAFLERFNYVLNQYPGLDYVWLWQPEAQGAEGYSGIRGANDPYYPALRHFGSERRQLFKRIVDEAEGEPPMFDKTEGGRVSRAVEGARLEQYAMLAWRALQKREHAPRLVISGWGGDRRILSAEYYEGLDRVLPKEVVFSSLDVIRPIRRVDKIYGQLPSDRQRWPIPWMENDGDQWMPQPYVDTYQDLMKDLISGGSQGVLGIHWRTRCIEENFQFIVDCAWNPGLRAHEFFQDFARRRYGAAIASEMADIHLQLDRLPYRWVGGEGQTECGEFRWGKLGRESDVLALENLREKCVALLSKADVGRQQLQWLIARMEYVLAYRQAEADYHAAQAVVGQNPKEALEILDRGALAKALQVYSRCLTTRGEYGVMATINSKAVISWKKLRQQCVAALGAVDRPDPHSDWKPQPGVIVPRRIGSAVADQDLTFEAIVLGGGEAYLHYRPVGSLVWKTIPLQASVRWVRKAVIPSTAIQSPGIEIGVSLDGKTSQSLAWGPHGISVMPAITDVPIPATKPGNPEAAVIEVKVGTGSRVPIALEWNDLHNVDAFKVFRDDKFLGVTAVAQFFDVPDQSRGQYRVEAIREGKVIAQSVPTAYTLPDLAVEENPSFTLSKNNLGVLVLAAPIQSSAALKYRLYRSGTATGTDSGSQNPIFEHLAGKEKENGGEKLLAEWPASQSIRTRFFDPAPAGDWKYRLELVNLSGRVCPQPAEQKVTTRMEPVRPVIDLPLTDTPGIGKLVGDAECTPEGLVPGTGYLEIPHQDSMHLIQAFTVQFAFKLSEIAGMPVILSHGAFDADGWYIQVQGGGRLVVRMPGCYLAGPIVKPGENYDVAFVFDGKRAHLKVNGAWTHLDQIELLKPEIVRPLLVGQYCKPEPNFQVKGVIRDLRFYANVPEALARECAAISTIQ